MLEQRHNQRFVMMMTLIILVAIFALFVIWTIVSQVSFAPTVGISTTIETVPIVNTIDVVEMSTYLKSNQTVVGLAPNWNAYQASLNYADYQSPTLLYTPVTDFTMNTPLVSYTSNLTYNLPAVSGDYVIDTPVVSYTSGLNYNLPIESQYFKGVSKQAITTRRYSLPLNNEYTMDVPLVSYTAGIEG